MNFKINLNSLLTSFLLSISPFAFAQCVDVTERAYPGSETQSSTASIIALNSNKELSRDAKYLLDFQEAINKSYISQVNLNNSDKSQKYKNLTEKNQCGIYSLIIRALASRVIAVNSNLVLDAAELDRSINSNDTKKIAEFSRSNSDYTKKFQNYSLAFNQLNNSIIIAEKNGFDVSSQKYLMSLIPLNLKTKINSNLNWPGLETKIQEIKNQDL